MWRKSKKAEGPKSTGDNLVDQLTQQINGAPNTLKYYIKEQMFCMKKENTKHR